MWYKRLQDLFTLADDDIITLFMYEKEPCMNQVRIASTFYVY